MSRPRRYAEGRAGAGRASARRVRLVPRG